MLTQIMRYSDPFLRLRRSKFRRKFHLDARERGLVDRYGMSVIKEHARHMVEQRLNNAVQDGEQTPYRGHPVFKAQHATATCCRKCLFKWHRIPHYRDLTEEELDYVTGLLMRWIQKEVIVRN